MLSFCTITVQTIMIITRRNSTTRSLLNYTQSFYKSITNSILENVKFQYYWNFQIPLHGKHVLGDKKNLWYNFFQESIHFCWAEYSKLRGPDEKQGVSHTLHWVGPNWAKPHFEIQRNGYIPTRPVPVSSSLGISKWGLDQFLPTQ